jgi:glucokinase
VFLGIEIGGTKLQLGVGEGTGKLEGLWRGTVDVQAGPEGIRRQIVNALPELLERCGLGKCHLHGIGVGFGGPVDDATHTVIKSHQIQGWDDFPLADWIEDVIGIPAVLGNDADVAGLAEALHGAGKGLSPIFYITIGSGIGGGFIINGEIYRGCGQGAAEIGQVCEFVWDLDRMRYRTLEALASGWGVAERARRAFRDGASVVQADGSPSRLEALYRQSPHLLTTKAIAQAASDGDNFAEEVLDEARQALAEAICHVIALLCPKRIVIGGGVSLMGETLLFEPLRQLVAEKVFHPFAGLTEIVPAQLGEEVVVHGAIALARKQFKK